MENMKMSDVFKLPMVCEDGDGFIYSNDLRHSIQFDDSDTYMMDHKKAVTHAISNHDRLAEENAELREFVSMVADGDECEESDKLLMAHCFIETAKQLLNK